DKPKRIRDDVVEVDVDAIDIPHGAPQKLPANSSEDDVSRKRKKEMDDQGFTYSWSTEQKVRPGLNVFDEKGNELEWDYEHDTRFFDDPSVDPPKDELKTTEVESGAPQAKVVRGRGAKKGSFLFNGEGGTLASDDIDEISL
ncbi:hypothetical protein OSTOST_16604, partial [Ostertagia ostertagi]